MTNYTFRNDQPGRGTADDFLNVLHEVGQWLVDSGHEMWETIHEFGQTFVCQYYVMNF